MTRAHRLRGLMTGVALQALFLGGCAASKPGTEFDPLEGMNRQIFWFNDQADHYVLEPVGRGWDWLVPDRVQESIRSFFINLRFPINLGNDLMQLQPRDAGVHTARFMVNMTFGLVGFFDPATDWGLVALEEDFGQTLGFYGVGPGPYLMIPLIGPSCLRDVSRFPVDGYMSGLGYALNGWILAGMTAGELVNFRSLTLSDFDNAHAASLDYYTFVRNAFLQRRQALINDSREIPAAQSEDLYDVDYDDESEIPFD